MNTLQGEEGQRILEESKFWNKAAATYDKPSGLDKAYQLSIEKCISLLKGNENVLEVACGTGTISLGIASHAKFITGVDIAEEMIKVAREKARQRGIQNVAFEVGDSYHMPFESGSFDVVLIFNALHIVKDPNALMAEAYRLLKKDGYLISATDCYGEELSFTKQIYHQVPKLMNKLGMVKYLNCFKRQELEELMDRHHFKVIEKEVIYQAPLNYYMVARK